MGAFDQEVALELSDGVDDIHGHLSSRTGEVDTTKGQAMNADAYFFKFCDGGADIDGVAAQTIKLGDDQHVAFFHPIEQLGKSLALRDGHRPRDGFSDDTMLFDSKTSSFDFPDLIFGCLIKCGDAGVAKGSGHGSIRYEIGVRNDTYVL